MLFTQNNDWGKRPPFRAPHLMKTQVVLDCWRDIEDQALRRDHHHEAIQRLCRQQVQTHTCVETFRWRVWNTFQLMREERCSPSAVHFQPKLLATAAATDWCWAGIIMIIISAAALPAWQMSGHQTDTGVVGEQEACLGFGPRQTQAA